MTGIIFYDMAKNIIPASKLPVFLLQKLAIILQIILFDVLSKKEKEKEKKENNTYSLHVNQALKREQNK